jgi:1,4-dihydroxy-2-naphthoate octaprenyltransferase
VIALLVLDEQLPALAWISLFALVPGLFAYRGAFKYGHELGRQPQYLAANVVVTLLTPLLLAVAIYFG